MNELCKKLKAYLYETLNQTIEPHLWKNHSHLPIFLNDAYTFYTISLLGQPCLLMMARENADTTPGMIRKHLEQVQKQWNNFIIYVQSTLSSFNRKRLIGQQIPFIIPGNQMYLPHFGIDLREHFLKIHNRKNKALSPSAQAVVIYALTHQIDEKLTCSLLAEKLGYTLMTITRVFTELKAVEIGEFYQEGRERWWTFSNKQMLWKDAAPFLRSPVKKRVWLKDHHFKIVAGLTALSSFSSIAPPSLSVFAASIYQWREWNQLGFEELPSPDDAEVELEIWHYDPALFTKNGIADPFSLYLSLKASQNERIESALEELMEKIAW